MRIRVFSAVAAIVLIAWLSFIGRPRSALSADSTSETSIGGTVQTQDGKPIAGATATIISASIRGGNDTVAPWRYPDAGKTAKTDAAGEFKIGPVDRTLTFQLVVFAAGYEPNFEGVNSTKVRPKLTLQPRPAMPNDPKRIVSGVVVDSNGHPLAGAVIRPRGYRIGPNIWYGNDRGFDRNVVTDDQGKFYLVADKPVDAINLMVTAREAPRKMFEAVPTAAQDNRLQMPEGASLRGRVVDHGEPVAGAKLGLVQANRSMQTFVGLFQIAADSRGRFLFTDLPANEDYFVYGTQSLGERSAIGQQPVHVGVPGSESNAGDLTVGPAYHLRGRIVLSDGKPVPPMTQMYVYREGIWNNHAVKLNADGEFDDSGLTPGVVDIYLYTDNYHLSKKNKSLDPTDPWRMLGRVDKDTDMQMILMDPGRPNYQTFYDEAQKDWQKLSEERKQVEAQPLMGVSEPGLSLFSIANISFTQLRIAGTAAVFLVLLFLVVRRRRQFRAADRSVDGTRTVPAI